MFADDTNLSCQGKSSTEIANKINTDLEDVHKWLIANKLTLNQEKTECMLVGPRQRLQQSSSNLKYLLATILYSRSQVRKFLGVIIDEQLKWQEHTMHNAKKCPSQLLS
jgi:hypothetical protein